MANLIDINDVPELTELKGSEKVLLNVNGEAKQAQTELIKPGYDVIAEWTGVSNETGTFTFNVIKNPGFLALKDIILKEHRPIRGLFYGSLNLQESMEEDFPISIANTFNATAIYPMDPNTFEQKETIVAMFSANPYPTAIICITIDANDHITVKPYGGK